MSLLSTAARTVADWVKLGFPEEVAKRIVAGGVAATAATQSDDAEAGFVTRGGKTLLEAWHGSPHKFDKFSMDAIGTGEGAQAYGHGLYFADSEDVARGYQEALSPTRGADGDYIKSLEPGNQGGGRWGLYDKETGYLDTEMPVFKSEAEAQSFIDNPPTGALYRTEIDVTPESLLDWDKPLSEQSEGVKQALEAGQWDNKGIIGHWMDKSAENPAYDGNDLYQRLSGTVGSSQEASSYLSDRGIKGIKYLDGDSRAAGDGTSNYVIFDDSLINIAERGSADPRLLAGIAAGGGGVSAATALSNKLAAAQAVRERGDIRAPNSGMLHSITMSARDLERRLEGHPAALLFPEGVVKYLEQLNREERPSRETVLWALLDMI